MNDKYRVEQRKAVLAEDWAMEVDTEAKARSMVHQEERDGITRLWSQHARELQWFLNSVRESSKRADQMKEVQASEYSGRLRADKEAVERERDNLRIEKTRAEREIEDLQAQVRNAKLKADDSTYQVSRESDRLREDLRLKDDELQRALRQKKEREADFDSEKARLEREVESLRKEKDEIRDRVSSSASVSEKAQYDRVRRMEDEKRDMERRLDDMRRDKDKLQQDLDSARKGGGGGGGGSTSSAEAPQELVVAAKARTCDSSNEMLGGLYVKVRNGLESLLDSYKVSSSEQRDWPFFTTVWERKEEGRTMYLYSTKEGVWKFTDLGSKDFLEGTGCGRDMDFRSAHRGDLPHRYSGWPRGITVEVPTAELEVSMSGDDKSGLGGLYKRQGLELANGYPIWERVGGRRWLYSTPSSSKRPGVWSFADSRLDLKTGDAVGSAYCKEAHNGCMPHNVATDQWQTVGLTVRTPDDTSALRKRVAELESQLKAGGGGPAKIEVGAQVRVRDSDRDSWKDGTVIEMRGEKPVVKVEGASRGFTWGQVELRGAAAAAAASAAPKPIGVGDRVRVRDTERESWREGVVTEMRMGNKPVVKVDGASRGFTWGHVEPVGGAAASGAGGKEVAALEKQVAELQAELKKANEDLKKGTSGGSSGFKEGDLVRVRDTERETWREGSVTDASNPQKPIVKVTGQQRAFTWNFVEPRGGGGGGGESEELIKLRKRVIELEAEASSGGKKGFSIGDRVRMRDSERESWRNGSVIELRGDKPVVKADGASRGFTWGTVERLDGGGGGGGGGESAKIAELEKKLEEAEKRAASNKGGGGKSSGELRIGDACRVRDTEKEAWKDGVVCEMRNSKPVVKLNNQTRGFTWAYIEAKDGGGGGGGTEEVLKLEKERDALREELRQANSRADKVERELEISKKDIGNAGRRSSFGGGGGGDDVRTLQRQLEEAKSNAKHNESCLMSLTKANTDLGRDKKELEKTLADAEERIRVFERKREERRKRREKKGQRADSSSEDK
eukprot:Hpha_TRINITY_DN15170_c3_g4::TRINITY_DN15170_c3_g4_i1::g.129039::m.129039